MASNEETRAENIQFSFLFNQILANSSAPPLPPQMPETKDQAKTQFIGIKLLQIGPVPEWCLPRVNDKAKASEAQIDDTALTQGCPNPIG